ncbi:MAG: NADPH:quinone reductase [Synergistaceae bacterium]|nr:NADPH:quinone reductase [Synergistaceae bacterium]
MKAIVLREYGGPEVLRVEEIPEPQVSCPYDAKVAVYATALNRADVLQRRGKYPQPGPKPQHEVPGLEFCGVVEEVGSQVLEWKVGDRVMGLLAGGGYAEYVVTHERMLMPIPRDFSFHEAAAIPEVFLTAYDALFFKGRMEIGDMVLIHAGGSGVGTAAIQLAKVGGASRIFVTAGSVEKCERTVKLGADRAVNYKEEDFADVVLCETGGRGVDVILDFIGKPYLDGNTKAAAMDGRIVQIAVMGGAKGEVDLGAFMNKRLTLVGTTLRARPIEQKIALTQRFRKEILPLFESSRLKPIVDTAFPLERAAEAHRYMEENRNFGKIVLAVR